MACEHCAGPNSGFAGDVIIEENVEYFDNSHRVLAFQGTVGGDVQVEKNTGTVGIFFNDIGGNLQCKDNDPPPGVFGNVVVGNAEDQCGP